MKGFFSGVELQMAPTASLVPKCGACGLYKKCKSPKMEPTGKGTRRVLFVAEAPGAQEDEQGIQLVGNSGHRLETDLRKVGVDMRTDCWLTNALICRPPDNEIEDSKRIDYCRPNLLKTIDRLKPEIIIPLGAMAVRSLIPYIWGTNEIGGIKRWAGWRIPCQKLNAWVCPTYHPSYLLRTDRSETRGESRVLDATFIRHLKAAFKLKGRPFDEVPDYASQVTILYTANEVCDFLDKITDGVIAFDFECNMLKPESNIARIVSCSVCWNGEQTIAFPMHGKIRRSMVRLLRDKGIHKIASNMKYEDRWARAILEVETRGWVWDTMVASHLLDGRSGITSIKFQSFVHLGQQKYDNHIEPYLQSKESGGNSENRIAEIPLDQLLVYNGLDSLLEYKVAEKHRKEMGCRPM